jgi:8-oxo-dGTP pyrophosphatase MutT (NUDIX family)
MNELLDIQDCLGNHIGQADRKVVHLYGLWHSTCHYWVVRKRNDSIYVLFQKRSEEKDDSPGMLDITAAGHLKSGETIDDGLRELYEELGVNPSFTSVYPLGRRVEVIDVPGFRNSEHQHVFMVVDDRNLSDYRLQKNEVEGLVEIEYDEGLKLLYGEVPSIQCASIRLANDSTTYEETKISLDDFIPRFDGYYKNIFIMAKLLFDGEKHLSI